MLADAQKEAPLRALTLENNADPVRILGGIIGVIFLFLLGQKQLFLIPVLGLGGAATGLWIGQLQTRTR